MDATVRRLRELLLRRFAPGTPGETCASELEKLDRRLWATEAEFIDAIKHGMIPVAMARPVPPGNPLGPFIIRTGKSRPCTHGVDSSDCEHGCLGTRDLGLDAVSDDCTRALQTKCYQPGSYGLFGAVATFRLACDIAGISDRTFSTTDGVRVRAPADRAPGISFATLSHAEISRICEYALQYDVSTRDDEPAGPAGRLENFVVRHFDNAASSDASDNSEASDDDDDSEDSDGDGSDDDSDSSDDDASSDGEDSDSSDSDGEDSDSDSSDGDSSDGADPDESGGTAGPNPRSGRRDLAAWPDGAAAPYDPDYDPDSAGHIVAPLPWELFALRPIQHAILNRLLADGEPSGSFRFESPPGSGKSTLMAYLCARLLWFHPRRRSVIFVPTKAIARDTIQRLREFAVPAALHGDSSRAPISAPVVVCIYPSALTLLGDFDTVFLDEAHHFERTPAKASYRASILRLARRAQLCIHMSATFRDTQRLDFQLDYPHAVEAGICCPAAIICPAYSGDGNRPLELAQYLARERASFWRTLAFCNTQKSAHAFAQLCRDTGAFDHVFVYLGDTKLSTRRSMLAAFEGSERILLVSVGALCEGVDIRHADSCVFVDARSSRINVWQCIGRVLRVAPGKELAHIVLPGDARELMAFARVLRHRIPTLTESVRSGNSSEFAMVSLGSSEGSAASDEIRVSLVHAVLGDFYVKLEVLRAWCAESGRLPTAREKIDDWAAGTWVSSRRRDYKRGRLAADRVAALEAIPCWRWGADLGDFMEKLEILRDWCAETGRLPVRSDKIDDWAAGKWVSHRRAEYKRGRLAEDRVAALEAIPCWRWDADDFMEKLEILRAWCAESGRLPAAREKIDDWAAGAWVSNRRYEYKSGRLAADRVAALEAIPCWRWAGR